MKPDSDTDSLRALAWEVGCSGGEDTPLPCPALPQGKGCMSLGGMRAPRRVLRDGGRQRELGLVG